MSSAERTADWRGAPARKYRATFKDRFGHVTQPGTFLALDDTHAAQLAFTEARHRGEKLICLTEDVPGARPWDVTQRNVPI